MFPLGRFSRERVLNKTATALPKHKAHHCFAFKTKFGVEENIMPTRTQSHRLEDQSRSRVRTIFADKGWNCRRHPRRLWRGSTRSHFSQWHTHTLLVFRSTQVDG